MSKIDEVEILGTSSSGAFAFKASNQELLLNVDAADGNLKKSADNAEKVIAVLMEHLKRHKNGTNAREPCTICGKPSGSNYVIWDAKYYCYVCFKEIINRERTLSV